MNITDDMVNAAYVAQSKAAWAGATKPEQMRAALTAAFDQSSDFKDLAVYLTAVISMIQAKDCKKPEVTADMFKRSNRCKDITGSLITS